MIMMMTMTMMMITLLLLLCFVVFAVTCFFWVTLRLSHIMHPGFAKAVCCRTEAGRTQSRRVGHKTTPYLPTSHNGKRSQSQSTVIALFAVLAVDNIPCITSRFLLFCSRDDSFSELAITTGVDGVMCFRRVRRNSRLCRGQSGVLCASRLCCLYPRISSPLLG